jgi:uncharacterized protein (TIGR04141 family)
LNHKYLRDQDFRVIPTTVAGASALLVLGQVPREQADWCSVLSGLTGDDVSVGHSSSGSALMVAVDGAVYALTYGTIGRYTIDLDRADPGFGIGFAIRAIGPERIKRITRSVLASSGRVDQSLVPGGQHIRLFAIERWGEIVGQLCGTLLDNRRLTVTRLTTRPVSIVGANSLQIPLSVDPEQLLDDLREITRVYAGDTPSSELEFIAQVRPLPPGTRTEQLDQRLDDLLGQDIPDGLGLAVPVALVEYEPFAMTYEIRVHGHRPVYRRELDLRTILERVRNHRAGRRLDALKNSTIALCADQDGRELLDRSVAGHKWITAEIGLGSARMIYHEGKWYEIGERHLEFLRAEIEDILNRQATVVLP